MVCPHRYIINYRKIRAQGPMNLARENPESFPQTFKGSILYPYNMHLTRASERGVEERRDEPEMRAPSGMA